MSSANNFTVLPVLDDVIHALGDLWDKGKDGLKSLQKWFDDNLPKINAGLDRLNKDFLKPVIGVLQDIWSVVQKPLTDLANWFIGGASQGLGGIQTAIASFVLNSWNPFQTSIASIYLNVSAGLDSFKGWFDTNLPLIEYAFSAAMANIGTSINNIIDGINRLTGMSLPKFVIPDTSNSMSSSFFGGTGIGEGSSYLPSSANLTSGITQQSGSSGSLGGVRYFAKGGFAGIGSNFVAGEAGPELGTVTPSGVNFQPMRSGLSGGSSNNTYTFIIADRDLEDRVADVIHEALAG